MPAFLDPGKGPPEIPKILTTIGLVFDTTPYKTLGKMRAALNAAERICVHFTEGLASIVIINQNLERIKELCSFAGDCPLEFWPLKAGKLDSRNIVIEFPKLVRNDLPSDLVLPPSTDPELAVYTEQISASLASLWASYRIYYPSERETLRQVATHARLLIRQYELLKKENEKRDHGLSNQKRKNAIISALVEVSAALSYAVTQGTSGSAPVLADRSPFPHHSLLGIGVAIRALNKFTRYLESAFLVRSASEVITRSYSAAEDIVPASIAEYRSGSEYKFDNSHQAGPEPFDSGTDFPQDDNLPLITHFSLRHGFMESKFSVTAASEALTAESLPQWTLMTLSHEIMHSRVRTIFQALFGSDEWSGEGKIISQRRFNEFIKWTKSRKNPVRTNVASSLRNVVLNFCFALEQTQNIESEDEAKSKQGLTPEKLNHIYSKHKHLANEMFVHFHDYYFAYACQPKMYMRSLWASWIKVAAPYARPSEYLTRSLATVACGTGLAPDAAFEHAKEILFESLAALESADVNSPLFSELRRLTSRRTNNLVKADFYPCYYLIDTVRRYFASRTIASKIDRIESDPFAEGSAAADEYTANIYVFGEEQEISPVRYSLASLFKALSKSAASADSQWLTAWNYMVISS